MINPEPACCFVGMAERQVLCALRVRKACRIEIQIKVALLCPVYPTLKMFRLDFVAINRLICFKVDCMQVDALLSRYLGKCHFHVRSKFLRTPRPAGVVSTCLYAAGKAPVRILKTEYVVALPTLDRNRDSDQFPQNIACVDTQLSESRFRELICIFNFLVDHAHSPLPSSFVPMTFKKSFDIFRIRCGAVWLRNFAK